MTDEMTVYKGIAVPRSVASSMKHMSQVEEYREALQKLQAVWNNLALLGQLSGTGIDISETRASFEDLSSRLLASLAGELRRKTEIHIRFRAQVAIDILVRNLFERTADIGFLAMDSDLAAFAVSATADPDAADGHVTVARMREYVRKYSVYHDVILIGLDGKILARLQESPVTHTRDALVREALETEAAYLETYRPLDLMPGAGAQLVYSHRVMAPDGSRPVAVLCLCFRLEDECDKIFSNLRSAADWTLIALIDGQGRVVASSDPHHAPAGVRFEQDAGEATGRFRFGGREYVAATCDTVGYQGYMGPGWRGHAMVPVEYAFDSDDTESREGVDASVLAALMRSEQLFGQSLREIPTRAEHIQADLTRSVWNGNVRQAHEAGSANSVFSRALLWEIGRTGARTRDVFTRSIRHLNQTVVSAMLDDCAAQAALAIDIMDRNLYERANDCRWWALTSLFRDLLSGGAIDAGKCEQMSTVLSAINRLYTVYTDLLLFDRSGAVVAVSNETMRARLGTRLEEDWVARTLRLRDTQDYCVSGFAASPLYGDRHTYIYCAAVRGQHGVGNVGGVAIVFDGEPQFRAMLADALPRDGGGEVRKGCIGLFVQRDGRIVASTEERFAPGASFDLDTRIRALAPGQEVSMIARLDGTLWAVGARMSSGYREYKSEEDAYRNDIAAIILVPLGDALAAARGAGARGSEDAGQWSWPRPETEDARIEVATFYVGEGWYGLPTQTVETAIGLEHFTRLPGLAARGVAGLTVYGHASIPVYDLPEWRGKAPGAEPAAQQIIVMRPEDGRQTFGVLVDALGDIPELARALVRPVPMMGTGMVELLDGVLTPRSEKPGAEVPMLLLVSPERLRARVLGTEPLQELAPAA
jgi:chemotaxis signal transduction protein